MSKRMKRILTKFSDSLLIDGTYQKNRFGMTIVDGVVVNNLGRTCIVFFALLEDDTFDSYQWLVAKLKKNMGKRFAPGNLFTDWEEALVKGKNLYFH